MQSRRVKVGVLGGGGILGAHGPALRKAAERGEVVAVACRRHWTPPPPASTC